MNTLYTVKTSNKFEITLIYSLKSSHVFLEGHAQYPVNSIIENLVIK